MTQGSVNVRMYNVGFGDSFLVTFPADDRPRKVLIDCGRHASSSGPPELDDVVARILEDVAEDDGRRRIDVVVGTHRHQDHVSGFGRDGWETVEVGEVWMPWTEDFADPQATAIRERQSRTARRAHRLLLTLGADASTAAEVVFNSLTNEEAMGTLHKGFTGAARRQFLPTDDRAERTFESPHLPGVRVHVLGPSRDPEVIRDMEPPVGESYLAVVEEVQAGTARPPFGSRWTLPRAEFEAESALSHLALTQREQTQLEQQANVDALGIAVALEKAVNGTSLMLAFEIGRAVLVFAGDAQWGTWQSALADPQWRRLLERTTFYKVSHHGSHNGTPPDFVEEVLPEPVVRAGSQEGVAAMVSTRPVKKWPKIPKQELIDALEHRAVRVIRSDAAAADAAADDTLFVDLEVPV